MDSLAEKVEEIYANGYRQQYSDLLNMLNAIEEASDKHFDGQILCGNLEELSEYIRTKTDDNGDSKYSTEAFLGITKLADHISLEVQRSREHEDVLYNLRETKLQTVSAFKDYSKKLDKSNQQLDRVRDELQRVKMELVAILSIFAAIVIAFSGGLNFLGGTLSGAANAELYDVAFAVLLCGILMFNIIAFMMYMVIAIVRLQDHDNPREGGWWYRNLFRYTGSHFIVGFNLVLIVLMAVVLIFRYFS